MLALRRPGERRLEALAVAVRERPLTYDEVGATALAELPARYHHERARREVGRGEVAWQLAQEALRRWEAGAPLEPGTVVVAAAGLGPLYVLLPCRIVDATDEPGRFGFAYGTLRGHPEHGEEAFHVTRDGREVVGLEIVAFSRPAWPPGPLAAPLSHAVQRQATRRYLDAVARFVAERR